MPTDYKHPIKSSSPPTPSLARLSLAPFLVTRREYYNNMNRLFGAKNTAPKPSLDDAIAKVS